ncbi:MAG: hypothetical protein QOF20_2156 [Acidimicrobiaceae bacterium]|nr:hypothetical protein [Acidimicrobiaceae bacterium]
MVFLGGLHRSGTSLLFRLLRQHPLVSGFEGTGSPEDEGQHLQSVYQPAKALGGEGRFGFHPGAHLVELAPDVAQAKSAALFEQWGRYWDLGCPMLVEKSPPNLVRMRFLQSMFPGARFVVIIRHPLAVALAERKRVGRQTVWSLLNHWFACHDTFSLDAPHIGQLLSLRYEDLLKEPQHTLERLLAFLELPAAPGLSASEVTTGPSDRYRMEWERLSAHPLYRPYAALVARRFEADANRYDYSIRDFSSVPFARSAEV